MNNLNCFELVQQIRTRFDETGITSGKWSDTEIVREINLSKTYYYNLINTINPQINGRSGSVTYVSGTELYDLPDDLDAIRRVEITGTKEKIEEISIDEKEIYRATNDIFDSRPCYYLWGNQIGLVNVSGNITIYYLKRVPDLHYGTVAALAATSLTFDATPNGSSANDYTVKRIDDYYIGAYVEIYSGTGVGQTRKTTDYVGSTKVATVATWDTNPDTSSLYALKYDLPNEVDECVILKTVLGLYPKDRTKDVATIGQILIKAEKAVTSGLDRSKERKIVEYVE